ncbi:Mov34/MPN/PAD-1 family protein [Bacillus benzoevorans]|uniref:Proteasome lid subunit RPN8/RPN11 n=1 Tax=Bacillus benzoevorans TaxID=1456 RepID=A0A7X0HQU3_9BACI|nr:M67 family metallopeptidase [Bacillus benzoevorans]MBB6445219.1 proteasome lid subunit RPN8/RPN11 [Bacillus benzoevorans]
MKVNSDKFLIKRSVYDAMIEHCKQCLPNEGCGLLSGIGKSGDTLWKLQNEANHPNRFHMSVEAIEQAVNNMESRGENLSGIFHSHPSSPAVPSSHDIANNPYTDIIYLIVSFYKGEIEVGCFIMEAQKAVRINVVILEE